jgi:hypothetical protein
MNMVARHLVQTPLHDQWQWLIVSAMDDLVILKGVLEGFKQLFRLDFFD